MVCTYSESLQLVVELQQFPLKTQQSPRTAELMAVEPEKIVKFSLFLPIKMIVSTNECN